MTAVVRCNMITSAVRQVQYSTAKKIAVTKFTLSDLRVRGKTKK
jgi:hypothetical protein